jgi:hypothetical protein
MGICSIRGCERPTKAKGLCTMHYQRRLRKGDPLAGPDKSYKCKIEDCMFSTYSKGFCWEHYKINMKEKLSN